MPTRQQINEEGFEALITLITEANETAAGELPPSEYPKESLNAESLTKLKNTVVIVKKLQNI